MVGTHALMESVSANLHECLHAIGSGWTRLQKRSLRDGLVGLLPAGRPVVCRTLPDQRTTFLSRLDRLEDNLNRQSRFGQKLKAAVPALWLPLVGDQTPIILDGYCKDIALYTAFPDTVEPLPYHDRQNDPREHPFPDTEVLNIYRRTWNSRYTAGE